MPYIAPVAAYVDQRGYLWCVDCKPSHGQLEPMYRDNAALRGTVCEGCGVDPRKKVPEKVKAGRMMHKASTQITYDQGLLFLPDGTDMKAPAELVQELGDAGPVNITYDQGLLFFEDGTDMKAPSSLRGKLSTRRVSRRRAVPRRTAGRRSTRRRRTSCKCDSRRRRTASMGIQAWWEDEYTFEDLCEENDIHIERAFLEIDPNGAALSVDVQVTDRSDLDPVERQFRKLGYEVEINERQDGWVDIFISPR